LARIAARRGEAVEAGRLLERADLLHAQISHVVDDADRTDAQLARRLLERQAPVR